MIRHSEMRLGKSHVKALRWAVGVYVALTVFSWYLAAIIADQSTFALVMDGVVWLFVSLAWASFVGETYGFWTRLRRWLAGKGFTYSKD